jgi:WD40 repeat protein
VSGKELAVLHHGFWVKSAVFSPDGTKVLTASWDHTARLWDAASGRELAVLRHGGDKVSAVFSPDGAKVLTVSGDSPARLWDAASGKELAVLRDHELPPSAIAFSPDGRTVVTGSTDHTARLWDSANGRELTVLRHGSWVTFVVFSPDGGTLATVSTDDQHRVWLWPVGQRLIDRACARVHALPLSNENKKRFGIDNEWCTPEVSAALRLRLGMDVVSEKRSASATTAR